MKDQLLWAVPKLSAAPCPGDVLVKLRSASIRLAKRSPDVVLVDGLETVVY